MALKGRILPIFVALCISSGYTENSNVKYMYNTPINTINSEQKINRITTNNTSINNNSEKQLSITEQLDKRIEYINNLIKSIYNKDKELNSIIQSFKQSYKEEHCFESLKSMCYDLKQKLVKDAEKYSKDKKYEYNKRMKREILINTIFELEETSLILQKLKNTDVFQKLVDFIRSNSKELLDGKVVNFSPVFTKIVKDKVNNNLREICYSDDVAINELLKECGLLEINTDENPLDLIKIQVLLMYEALALCPELKVEHVLEINSEGSLINGVKINNSTDIYGYLFKNTLEIGICKDKDHVLN